jgi:ATP-dependent Lon protease
MTPDEIQRDVGEFISKHLPAKTDKQVFLNRLQQGEVIVVLDSFSAFVDLRSNRRLVRVPSLDIRDSEVADSVIDANKDLLKGGLWGAGRLVYSQQEKGVTLIDFKPMQAGSVALQALVEGRKAFSLDEWIDVLLRTMGLEPTAYNNFQKRTLLGRLIPLVQSNVNMMELAPKGTGKSFLYSNLSRYVWLNSGGALSQAQLFLNLATKEVGLLGGRFDLLVLDEGQSIDFRGADDVHAKFKDYLESGRYTVGGQLVTSECGLMILANIELLDGRPVKEDFVRELPEMFQDSALLDRFHGIIAGWDIPRFQTSSSAEGFGVKADVFGELAHQLRHSGAEGFPFGRVPALRGDIRDVKAAERTAAALSKILMINPADPEYNEYVLEPAIQLRQRVRSQLAELDPYGFAPKINVTLA